MEGIQPLIRDRCNQLPKKLNHSIDTGIPRAPNILLLHIIGEHAEYRDSTGANSFRYAYQSLKTLVTGTTPEIKEGEQHGKVNLPM